MLKTHMTACLLASALVTAPALAQSTTAPATDRPTATGAGSTTSGSSAMQPGGTAGGGGMSGGAAGTTAPGATGMGSSSSSSPSGNVMGTGAGAAGTPAPGATMGSSSNPSGSATGMGAGSAGSGTASTAGTAASMKPLASPQPGQIMGSDLRGTRVYGANNESIGDISDLLLDRQGQVVAAIIGVGGFLGIGQKDVAVPFQALEIVPQGAAAGSSTSGGPAATGTTGTAGSSTGTINPDRVVLRTMTRAELEAAPSFRSSGQASGTGTSSAPSK